MNNLIQNKNLFVAEKLLGIITQKTELVFNNRLSLEKEFVPELSDEEFIESLKRLEERGVVRFDDEEDRFDTYDIKYVDLVFNKDKLIEFIEITKDRIFKITTQYKENLEYVLEALTLILQPKYLNKKIEFSELGYKHIEISEWIADYSGIIKVIYELEADFDYEGDLKRPYFVGAGDQPKKIEILDRLSLENLNNEIRQFAIKPYQKRIKLFLKKNPEIDWRCAKCGRFFERIDDENQIANCLNDFLIHKFKKCHKCGKVNCFSINSRGDIKFLLTKKLLLGEKVDPNETFRKLMAKLKNKNKIAKRKNKNS